ncbi:MAG: hypothetical protein WC515_05895 [Candidatus Omnitrophota bacterium]
MAQERPATPEKQLLGLIETNSAKPVNIQAQAVKHQGMSMLSRGAWMGRLSFFRDNLKRWLSGDYLQLDIKLLNNVLIVLIAMLTVYLLGSVYSNAVYLTKLPSLKYDVKTAKGEEAGPKSMSVLKNAMSYYLEKVRQRDIFKIGEQAPPERPAVPGAPVQKVAEEGQRFKLVGISWSKEPDAMIEDTLALRTFFVKRGQMLGRVKVEAIFKDKVVLSCDGTETELR